MQERKVREKRRPRDFYTDLLKPELHAICQDNLSLTFHYFKRFTNYPPLHFQNMQKHHKRLLNHTRITPAQQEPSCRLGNPPSTHTKLEKDQTSVVAQPSLPQTTFSKLQTKPKAQRIDPRPIFNCCILYHHDGDSFQNKFVAIKWSTYLSFENHSFYSQTVMKFNRLISKSISWFHLT